jgi:hypothetical protein
MRVWGMTDGSAGMAAQVRALAFAMGAVAEMKVVRVKKPFVWLPNAFHAAFLSKFIVPYFIEAGSDALDAPWPDVVISCGRRASLVAMGMRAKSAPHKPIFINIQDPRVDPRHFDLVVAMAHDAVEGDNVIKTTYALHSITPEKLAEARAQFAARFAAYATPHVAVLLGGSTNKYQLDAKAMAQVIAQLKAVVEAGSGSLLITPSRRTGEANIALLREAFAGDARVYIYDFVEANPYLGLLALADVLVVTDDSVNMMSEAHATGKPIYLLHLPGHANTKPANFSLMMEKEGAARPLVPVLERWSYRKSHEMEWLSKKMETRLANFVW